MMSFVASCAAGVGAYVFVRYILRSDKVQRDRWRDYGVEQFGMVGGNAGYDRARHGYNVGRDRNVRNVGNSGSGVAAPVSATPPSCRNYDEYYEERMAGGTDEDSDFDDRDPFAPTNFMMRSNYE